MNNVTKCNNLNEFCKMIEPVYSQTKMSSEQLKNLEKFIDINQRLILQNTDKIEGERLQVVLKNLSKTLVKNPEANALAFRIDKMAQGLYIPENQKGDISKLPPEMKSEILKHLNPADHQPASKQQFANSKFVSKDFLNSAQMAEVSEEKEQAMQVDKKYLGLKAININTGKEAVDYAIKNQLRNVDLRGIEITNEDMQRLLNQCRSIQRLIINSSLITDEAFQNINTLNNLHTLSLYRCDNLTGNFLSSLKELNKLTRLSLSGCSQLKEKAFEKLNDLPQLESLWLVGCVNFTDNALEKLTNLINLTDFDYSETSVQKHPLEPM
jgi:hypothetical protein